MKLDSRMRTQLLKSHLDVFDVLDPILCLVVTAIQHQYWIHSKIKKNKHTFDNIDNMIELMKYSYIRSSVGWVENVMPLFKPKWRGREGIELRRNVMDFGA